MLIWKDVLKQGKWFLRDGREFECRPEDIPFFASGLKRMLSAGLDVPSCWEHQPECVPLSRHATMTKVAKETFGHIKDVRIDSDNVLWTATEVEDPKDAEQLKKTKFCSPWIEMQPFIDDTGREWPAGMILHIAATPTPINRDQQPFRDDSPFAAPAAVPMSAGFAAREMVGLRFGLNTKPVRLSGAVHEDDMAEDFPKKKKDDEKPDEAAAEAKDDDEQVVVPDDEPPAAPEPPPAVGVPEVPEEPVDQAPLVKELLELLTKDKMHLGDDTTPENFLERLKVALVTKQAHDEGAEGEGAEPNEDELPPAGNDAGAREAGMPSPVMMSAAQVAEKVTAETTKIQGERDFYAQRLLTDRKQQLQLKVTALKPLIGDAEVNDLLGDLRVISDAEILHPVALSSIGSGAVCMFLKQLKRLKRAAERKGFTDGATGAAAVALSAATPPTGVHEVGPESVGGGKEQVKTDDHVMSMLSGGRFKGDTKGAPKK